MNEMQSGEHGGSTRRRFLKLFTGTVSSLFALVLGIPLVGALVGPSTAPENFTGPR